MRYDNVGTYTLIYSTADDCGNETEELRTVTVQSYSTVFSKTNATLTNNSQDIGSPVGEMFGNDTVRLVLTNGSATIDGATTPLDNPTIVEAKVQQSGMFPQTRVVNFYINHGQIQLSMTFVFKYDANNITAYVSDNIGGGSVSVTGDILIQKIDT